MPEYRHPLADADTPGKPPAQIHVGRREDNVAVADDGTFTVPAPCALNPRGQRPTPAVR
jgi:hypothetical protein